MNKIIYSKKNIIIFLLYVMLFNNYQPQNAIEIDNSTEKLFEKEELYISSRSNSKLKNEFEEAMVNVFLSPPSFVSSDNDIKEFSSFSLSYSDYVSLNDPFFAESIFTQFSLLDILQMNLTISKYNGSNSIISIIDSGIDFGVSDLSDSFSLDNDNLPISFDPSGVGLALSPLPLTSFDGLLYTEDLDYDYIDAINMEKISTSVLGIVLEDYNVSEIIVSKSNNYKFGLINQFITGSSFFFPFILVDSIEASTYDTLYVDLDTGLGLSLLFNGKITKGSNEWDELVDWSFNDEQPHKFDQTAIVARDLNNDTINDVSAGSLTTGVDKFGLIGEGGALIKGIDPTGKGISLMYDSIGHGTACASIIASKGLEKYPVYNSTEIVNNTEYNLKGVAPEAKIIAVKGQTIADLFSGWLWSAGFEPDQEGEWEWVGKHIANISSNSWGISDLDYAYYVEGYDYLTQMITMLSQKGSLHPDYPGQLVCIAGGNGGPGYGTITPPSSSPLALTVGSTMSYHYLEPIFGVDQGKDSLPYWSAKGPTMQGIVKPDLLAPGTGYTLAPLLSSFGESNQAFTFFSGTSFSCPLVTGLSSLIVQQYHEKEKELTPQKIKEIIKMGTDDLGFDVFSQGMGNVNASKLIQLLENNCSLSYFTSNSTFSSYLDQTKTSYDYYFGEQPTLYNLSYLERMELENENIQDLSAFGVFTEEGMIPLELNNEQEFNYSIITYEKTSEFIDTERTDGYITNYDMSEIVEQLPEGTKEIRIMFTLIHKSQWTDYYQNYAYTTPFMVMTDWEDKNANGIIDEYNASEPLNREIKVIGTSEADYWYLTIELSNLEKIEKPILRIYDPLYHSSSSYPAIWEGLLFKLTIMGIERTTWEEVELVEEGGWHLNINATSLSVGFYQGQIEISSIVNGTKYETRMPISFGKYQEIGLEEKSLTSEEEDKEYYSNNLMYPAVDWGWREESGDWRNYPFKVEEGMKSIIINLEWLNALTMIDVYLISPSGRVVNSEVNYLGGGQYESTSTDLAAQRLWWDLKEEGMYYLVFHLTAVMVTETKIDLRMKALEFTREEFMEKIVPEWLNEGEMVDETIGINWLESNFSALQEIMQEIIFEENEFYAMKGELIEIKEQIKKEECVEGMFTPEKYVVFNLKGESIVKISCDWDSDADFDFYLFEEGTIFEEENDLLKYYQTGSMYHYLATTSHPEEKECLMQEGNYIIAIDYYGERSVVDHNITITIESELPIGQEIEYQDEVDLRGLEDGNYTFITRIKTNYNLELIGKRDIIVKHYYPPNVRIVNLENNDFVSRIENITWECDDEIKPEIGLYYYPSYLSEPITLAEGVIDGYFLWDTTKIQDTESGYLKLKSYNGHYYNETMIQIRVDHTSPIIKELTEPDFKINESYYYLKTVNESQKIRFVWQIVDQSDMLNISLFEDGILVKETMSSYSPYLVWEREIVKGEREEKVEIVYIIECVDQAGNKKVKEVTVEIVWEKEKEEGNGNSLLLIGAVSVTIIMSVFLSYPKLKKRIKRNMERK
ncbi:MAG: S8 family serine peptidase [Candidatus Kariarchaeaceae archaeon]